MSSVTQMNEVRPSVTSTMRPAAPAPKRATPRAELLLRAAAPIDADENDPIGGILAEAGSTLNLAMTALEAMGAAERGSGLSPLFTTLLALERRLDVAGELRIREQDARFEGGHDDDAPPSARRAKHAPLDVTGLSPQAADPFQDAVDVVEGSLWNMREFTRALAALAVGNGTEGGALVRHVLEAEDTYREAMAALKVLSHLEIERGA